MEDVLLIYFEDVVSFFSTLIQNSCFVKRYNIYSLNNLEKITQAQKYFSRARYSRDKFQA